MARWVALVIASLASVSQAGAIDVDALWDFNQPELSEQRFRSALAGASADDAIILQTQIARSLGLRREFAKARELLAALEPRLAGAGAEAKIRHALETGRTLASATHAPQSQTPEAREQARSAYLRAFALARREQFDKLAIDALHMLAFVDTEPADQLRWSQEALAIALASVQPDARAWEASLRNNVGHALRLLGRDEEALAQFERAVVLREAGSNPVATRIAHWMVARTLRALNRVDEALEIQLRLEREGDAAAAPDPYVFEELEQLYRLKGDPARARHYAQRRQGLAR